MVDCLSIYVAITEVWNLSRHSWTFTSDMCQLFSGTEVLTNTLTSYLLICFNFHVVSLWNLHVTEMLKSSKNPLTTYTESESNECLMPKSSSANRNVTIDYRRRKSDISVILPIMLVWFVSLSLSIPEYTLSSTFRVNDNLTLCTIIDINFGQVLQTLLLVFRIIIPIPLFTLSVIMLAFKLCQTKRSEKSVIDNVLTKKSYRIESLLIFSLVLSVVYLCSSFQRYVFYFLHVMSQKYDNEKMDRFMTPPFHNFFVSSYTNTYLTIMHYSASAIRPLLYIYLLPKFKFLVKSKICLAKKNSV